MHTTRMERLNAYLWNKGTGAGKQVCSIRLNTLNILFISNGKATFKRGIKPDIGRIKKKLVAVTWRLATPLAVYIIFFSRLSHIRI